MARGKKPALVWAGEHYNPTGYGEEARGFILALDRKHFRLQIIPMFSFQTEGLLTPRQEKRLEALERVRVDAGQAVVVQHRAAYLFARNFRGRVKIGRTMFETDRISAGWVEQCNRMDEIWVPSLFNVETFNSSGVARAKLRVVPGGVDARAFHPAAPPLKLRDNNDFIFLSVFDWTDRKGWDLLLTAFYDEFQAEEEVMLLLKTYRYSVPGSTSRQFDDFVRNRLARERRSFPMVRILDCEMPNSLMPSLYTACDAFVLPSRGESWGRPYLEAMACGLPVLGTKWSGNLEYMNDENSYLIEIEGIEAVPDTVDVPFYAGHRWARPSVEHLRHLMRHVFEHRQEARAKGERARADVCRQWTWEQAASAVVRELVKYDA